MLFDTIRKKSAGRADVVLLVLLALRNVDRCDAHFIWQHWTSCSSDMNPQVLKSETNKKTATLHLSSVCVAGGVHALSPQDWAHSLHCVLHFWKHMCSVQVSVHNDDNKSDSSSWGWKLMVLYQGGICNEDISCFLVWQHHVSNGAGEAAEEDVWQNESTGDDNNDCECISLMPVLWWPPRVKTQGRMILRTSCFPGDSSM